MSVIIGNSKQDASNGSPIEITPELEVKVSAATSQAEIQALMHGALEKQYASDGQLKKGITVNGATYELTAPDASTLAKKEAELWQRLTAPDPVHQHRETELDKTMAADRTQLEAEYRLGRISLSDFIQRAGLVEEHLNRELEQEWAKASNEFLRSPEGLDWPATPQARERIGHWIEQNGLTDTNDKLAALKQGFAAMQQADAAEQSEQADAELKAKLDKTNSVAEINEILGRRERNHYDSGYYGR